MLLVIIQQTVDTMIDHLCKEEKKGFRFGIYVWDSGDLVGQRALIYCQCVKCLNDGDKGKAINVTVAVRKVLCVRRVT